MFVNIITPCSRPENLHKIAESIKLSKYNYQWIIVHDADKLPDINLLPLNAIHIANRVKGSISGNGQRNVALDLVSNDPYNWIYFNDDDTIIHPELWDNVRANYASDFIHFQQEDTDGNIRLYGNSIEVGQVDSHNFIFKVKLLGDTRWQLDRYDADGYFAKEIYAKAKHPIYLNKILSTYNLLK